MLLYKVTATLGTGSSGCPCFSMAPWPARSEEHDQSLEGPLITWPKISLGLSFSMHKAIAHVMPCCQASKHNSCTMRVNMYNLPVQARGGAPAVRRRLASSSSSLVGPGSTSVAWGYNRIGIPRVTAPRRKTKTK